MTQHQQHQQHQQQHQQQHRRQQQDEVGGDDGDGGACDESKCVSEGMSGYFDDYFTCYTYDDECSRDYYPMMCADGYKPRIVESEPDAFSYVDVAQNQYPYKYFTCCPPKLSTETNVRRHCSDPILYDTSINEALVCNDDTRPYAREMKTSKDWGRQEEVESYMCCDSAEHTTTSSFLDDTECVPYRDEFYQKADVWNDYGMMGTMTCYIPDGDFQFPRLVPTTDSDLNDYECCKTGSKQPFFQDATFKMTVYPQIVISSIAVLSCMIVIVGLSIPLLIQMRKRRTQTTQRTNRRARQRGAADYSTYNLYLVYLAIPDLILNLYLLGMYGSYANQKYNPKFHGSIIYDPTSRGSNYQTSAASNFEGAFVVACSTANLYLNAIVSYEVLVFLRNSHQRRSTNPPSLLKVTLQAVAVYFVAIVVFIIHYCIARAASVALGDDFDRYFYLLFANLVWSLVVTYILPIGFFVCVSIIICCRGYMPSATGRMKELALYFFRIIVIFCVLWIPGMMFLILGAGAGDKENDVGISLTGNTAPKNITIGLLFCALQPIASMCMAMTKTDVRKYIFDLVALSYIRKSGQTTIATSPAAATAAVTAAAPAITQEKKSFTVLGTKEEKVTETLAAKDADGIMATLTTAASATATYTNGSPTTTMTTTPETKEN